MSNNTTVRVTKAQKLEVLKKLIPDDASHVFPGTSDDKGNTVKTAYVFDKEAIMEFLDYEISLLAKKNSGEKKPTAKQQENETYRELILAFLLDKPDGVTCTEIQKGVPEFADFQNQKIAALIKPLHDAKKVNKTTVKGKTLITLA